MTIFIGDVHGKYKQLKRIVRKHENVIQVGDLGVGFINTMTGRMMTNPPHYLLKERGFRAIRGNHDNPSVFFKQSYAIKDGHTEITPKGTKVMFMGGALSIDKQWRTQNCDYWEDEELTQAELYEMISIYDNFKPDVMVTHDCPEFVAVHMKNGMKMDFPSITRQALDAMYDIHQPAIHLYGHWHESYHKTHRGTEFICLNELETMEINI